MSDVRFKLMSKKFDVDTYFIVKADCGPKATVIKEVFAFASAFA